MASLYFPTRRRLVEAAPVYFPFSGKLSRNALEDFNSSKKTVKILFLNCKDLKNVLQTIALDKANKKSQLNIHLNHHCLVSFARNVLILKIISSPGFEVNNKEDFDYLWDLWYNFEWTKNTLQRFEKDVKNFIEKGLSQNCFLLESGQLDDLKDIFGSWLSSLTKRLTRPLEMKTVRNDRLQFYNDEGSGELGGLVAKATGLNKMSSFETLHRLASWRDEDMETKDFPPILQQKLSQETKKYFETGNCTPSKRSSIAAINPTLLEPKTLLWRVDFASCPFDSYLPLPLKDLETSADEGIATRYCQKMLKDLVAAYQNKKKTVSFRVHYKKDDLLQSFKSHNEKFDVIDCCSLADEVGLANVFAATSELLELDPDALLLTESFQWGSVGSTVPLYLEESLCAPLSMIPTIYGLQLDSNVELGWGNLMERDVPVGYPPVTLLWRHAVRLENVPLSLSSSLEKCLKKLKKKCFFMEIDDEQFHSLKELVGLKRYTPLTYRFVATRLTKLAGEQGATIQKMLKLNQHFSLTKKALKDWDQGNHVSLVITTQPFSKDHEMSFALSKMFIDSPWLRIVLVPVEKYSDYTFRINSTPEDGKIPAVFSRNWVNELPFLKFIDNFELNYPKKQDGSISSVDVKFFLPEDHGLDRTDCAVLVDLITGLQVMLIGFVKDWVQVIVGNNPNNITKPFKGVQRPRHGMQALSCLESDKDFEVKIGIYTQEDPKGLNVFTDQKLPCQSAHRVTFSLDQPKGIQPITLSFPYPVSVNDINATLSLPDCSIRVVLKKALLEPWPCHFSNSVKWEVEKFNPWKEPQPDARLTRLMVHIAGQMEAYSPITTSSDLLTPLQDVRRLILKMLAVWEKEYFLVTTKNGCSDPFFHFRAHPPLLKSPSGSPILLISAIDHCQSEKLVAKGMVKSKQSQDDFQRIFGHRMKRQMVELEVISEETADLLRYVLRLNSTKMIPTVWQEENLPLGPNSPYLATFLSPLYLENLYPYKNHDEELFKKHKVLLLTVPKKKPGSVKPQICTGCDKQSMNELKRCSQCKLAYYCTVSCQRAHWKEHKKVCAAFK